MKKGFWILLMIVLANITSRAADLVSPNGSVKVNISVSDRIYYSIYRDKTPLIENCNLGINLDGSSTDKNLKLLSIKSSSISRELNPVVPLKFSKIDDRCNTMLLNFKNGFSVEFRAYNDGIAYRIITNFNGDKDGKVKISDEDVTLNLPDEYMLHLQPAKDFTSNYETNYIHLDAKNWKASNQMATLPALIDTKKGFKILFGETDLTDYPCLFLKGNGGTGIKSTFSKVALEEKQEGDRFIRITKEADFIAQTSAKRTYPWRYFIISKDDGELLESTLPVKLAPKSEIKNTSWIKRDRLAGSGGMLHLPTARMSTL
jgi:alpha-glucosidase